MIRKKLHVLFLNSWYPSRVLPTNGDFIQRHAEAVAIYHQVTAIHVITDPELKGRKVVTESFEKEGVQTHIAYLPKTHNRFIKWWRYLRAFRKLNKKAGRYDLVHLNHIYPGGLAVFFLSFLKGVPYVISEHWTFYHEEFRHFIKPFQKRLSKWVCSHAAVICPVSNELAQAMKSFGLKGNYMRVPNVVDTDSFKPVETNSNDPILRLLHVSNMNDMQKNISGLLRVCRKLQEKKLSFQLTLIGSLATEYKALAKELGIRDSVLELFDQLPHEELIKYYQKADAFVLFSEDENLPCVILESFACGTAVISTDVGGIAEYFPENFGRLIERGNEDELLECILEWKQTKLASGEEMHQYAVQKFSPESIATQFTDIYHRALSRQ